MNAQLVDFNTVFDISQDKGRIVASALNPYGQVAGLVEWPDVSPRRSALFLWTPDHPNGHAGVITYLTDPTGQASSILLQINAFGQVTFARGNELVLWTPETSHGPEGSTHTIQQVAIADELNLRGLNAYGQIAGGAHGRTFLWTPEHPQATTGIFMWFDEEIDSVDALNDVGQVLGHDADEQAALLWTPTQAHGSSGHITRIAKPSNSSGVRFYALSGRGALAGLAYDASHALGNGPLNDALVWLPDAPNSSTGQVRTLGALGWNEDGITREVNAAGTALGDSCFLERQGFDGGCGQNRSFVWNPRDGMQDLQTLLDPGSGYTSTRAWALNDRGQILAVGASSSETYRLLLLTPH
jgi:hypothetical protein